MPMQFDVKGTAAFRVGHFVRRCQLVRRHIGGQAVCEKLLMAGHKLRVGNVEVVVRADAVIGLRVEAAAKLAFDHDRVQSRRAEPLVESCKFRCPYGLVQHLRDDLLLDGGEQRRVALSRALYKNAPLVLLDEPTSELDPETSRVIIEQILRLKQSATVIAASHDAALIEKADVVVTL